MTAAGSVTMTRYRLTLGYQTAVVDADLARTAYDAHPADLRSGERDGAFILWSLDHLGRRCAPIIAKPLAAQA